MKRDTQIVLSSTLWLLLLIPIYYHTIRVPRATLDDERILKLTDISRKPINHSVRVAVDDEMVPQMAQACQIHINRVMEKERNTNLHFIIDSECTSAADVCIHTTLTEEDTIIPMGETEFLMEYSPVSIVSRRQPYGVESILINGIYSPLINPGNVHNELTLSYTPRVHLIFSLLYEGGDPPDQVSWEISEAIDAYLAPMLKQLRDNIVDVTVETQVILHAKIGCKRRTILHLSQLSNFINFAEWSLSSSVTYPILNFVLYVPESPMILDNTPSNSFMISRWGGIKLGKPMKTTFYKEDLREYMNLFGKQLLILLGMREPDITHGKPPMAVRMKQLAYFRTIDGIKTTIRSLHALLLLTSDFKNIPIPAEVKEYTDISMDRLDMALLSLEVADIKSAVSNTSIAFDYAERAFFDKRMIAQAYLPDEHKMAVYIPLMAPLFIVVISAWYRLYKKSKVNNTEVLITK
ncbi:GPI-anchor transamidase [Starmerella bacillaris]|uniref:GPI-anchor transamidase n=1 Tax=Starmerella bacillaris TaxID=1247836 RepID=A0AAV5REB4_STABA|nr:GPI-anchor transamidase [Starmerella bacillaris]